MTIRRLLALSLAGALGAAVAVATPAAAYPRDDYSYAAAHMIARSDIPASLGTFKKSLSFSADKGNTNYACWVPTSDPDAQQVSVKYPGGTYSYSGSYEGRGKDAPSLVVGVDQYSSASAAIKAFNVLKKGIVKCTGTGSNTFTDDDGTTYAYSTLLTHGVVPTVSTLGVESLFVSNNSLQEETPGDSRYVNDTYTVYSLFGDVIIQTQYYSNTNTNLTTKQRRAVNRVAFNAETAWLAD
jgi:hypothetical protein